MKTVTIEEYGVNTQYDVYTFGSGEPHITFTAGIHGNEVSGIYVAQRLIGHALDGKAENDGEDEHQRNRNVHGHGRGGVDHDQACHHKDIAVGKVNEAQNAVDQRVADGDERVLTSHRDTADQIR